MEDPAEYTLDKSTIGSLSSETRVQILASLRARQKTNAELSKELDLKPPTIHHHLEQLKEAGLIESREDGHKWIYYRLTPFGQALFDPDKRMKVSIVLSTVLTFITGLVAICTFFVQPRLTVRLFPGLEDPYLPMFVVAVAAVIVQVGILGYVMRR
ncbi:winged helix-turn-helix domain-containing protein [Methanoregula formicica]|uniref:Bacterial regulatory protein, arsR family n=1 Tax=Methanoregula formicica (strain DSM 22288 / NBRC 105244 / SMSP) TaxID=593750 RepID=L0HIT9_METFS|nr:winged helix-turn-helix domain-containing protein [Methanoregula formicica]AGB03009.1 Bacterial regulatory protein, arsR family [Methanoregula formicica SMSP]